MISIISKLPFSLHHSKKKKKKFTYHSSTSLTFSQITPHLFPLLKPLLKSPKHSFHVYFTHATSDRFPQLTAVDPEVAVPVGNHGNSCIHVYTREPLHSRREWLIFFHQPSHSRSPFVFPRK